MCVLILTTQKHLFALFFVQFAHYCDFPCFGQITRQSLIKVASAGTSIASLNEGHERRPQSAGSFCHMLSLGPLQSPQLRPISSDDRNNAETRFGTRDDSGFRRHFQKHYPPTSVALLTAIKIF